MNAVHCWQHGAEWFWGHEPQPALTQFRASLSWLPKGPGGEQTWGDSCVWMQGGGDEVLQGILSSQTADQTVVHVHLLSPVWPFATLWTIAHQVPLSMVFSRQEYWSGLPFPSAGDLSDPGIEPISPTLAGGFFLPLSHLGSPSCTHRWWVRAQFEVLGHAKIV